MDTSMDNQIIGVLAYTKILSKYPRLRTGKELDMIHEYFKDIPFFKKFLDANEQELFDQCCKFMRYEFFEKNDYVFKQNDVGTKFYVILDGNVCILVNTPQELKKIAELKSGDFFGEIALLAKCKRTASVLCLEDSHIAYLDKATYSLILREYENKKIQQEIQYLCQLPIFSQGWNASDIKYKVYQKSTRITYNYGDIVYNQNDPITHVYIIKQGEFSSFQDFQLEKDDNVAPCQRMIKGKQFTATTQNYSDNQIFGDEEVYHNKKKRQMGMRCQVVGSQVLAVPIDVYKNVILRKEFSKNHNNEIKSVKQKTSEGQINIMTNVINNYKQYMAQSSKQSNFIIEDKMQKQIKQANEVASQDFQLKQYESRMLNNIPLHKTFGSKYDCISEIKDISQTEELLPIPIKKQQIKNKMFAKVDENLYQILLTDRSQSHGSITSVKNRYYQKVQNNYMQYIKDSLSGRQVGMETMTNIQQSMPSTIFINMLNYKPLRKECKRSIKTIYETTSSSRRPYQWRQNLKVNDEAKSKQSIESNSQTDLVKCKQSYEYYSQVIVDKTQEKIKKKFDIYYEEAGLPVGSHQHLFNEQDKNVSNQIDKNLDNPYKVNGQSQQKKQDYTTPARPNSRNPLLKIQTQFSYRKQKNSLDSSIPQMSDSKKSLFQMSTQFTIRSFKRFQDSKDGLCNSSRSRGRNLNIQTFQSDTNKI